MDKATLRYYRRYRQSSPFMLVGSNAKSALEAARTHVRWDELEAAGLVRLRAEPDDDYQWEDERERERWGDDGAWGSIAEWRASEEDEWEVADSCWGHVGYQDVLSPFENCYVVDHMSSAVEAYEDATLGSLPL